MSKTFSEMNPEQRKFIAICEWFAKMEQISDLEWLSITRSNEKFDAWARRMFDKYEDQLTDVFVAELTLLRYFTGD